MADGIGVTPRAPTGIHASGGPTAKGGLTKNRKMMLLVGGGAGLLLLSSRKSGGSTATTTAATPATTTDTTTDDSSGTSTDSSGTTSTDGTTTSGTTPTAVASSTTGADSDPGVTVTIDPITGRKDVRKMPPRTPKTKPGGNRPRGVKKPAPHKRGVATKGSTVPKSKTPAKGKPAPASKKPAKQGGAQHPATKHKTASGTRKNSPAEVEAMTGIGAGQLVMGRHFPGAVAHRMGAPRIEHDGSLSRTVTLDYGGRTEVHRVYGNGQHWRDREPGMNPPSRGIPHHNAGHAV